MSAPHPDVQLASLAKNGRERLHISVREFRGSRFLDLRIHATNAAAELVPTKAGVAVRPGMLRDVIAALQKAEALFVNEGALPGRTD